MASGPAVFLTTRENTNYARLCRLLVDVGSHVLRDAFDRIHPPATLHRILSSAHPTLQSLRKKRILNPTQWGKLYPTISSSVSSTNFDITLLMVLLRNICSLTPPVSTGSWDKLPLPGDNSPEANIVRIKYYRNQVYAHASQASVDDATFNMLWQDISNALLALGSGTTYASEISRLKTECMDPDFEEHYRELLKQWKKGDDNTKEKLDELKDMVKKWKSDEGSTKEKLENMEEMLKQWKSDEETTKDKVGQVEDMVMKLKSDDGSTKEKLESMEEMLTQCKSDEDCIKEMIGEVNAMFTQWKREEGNTKDKLGEIEDTLKRLETDEGSSKDTLKEILEMLKQWMSREDCTRDKLGEMEDAFGPADFVEDIRTLYKKQEGWLAPIPWCEELTFKLDNIFTRLKMVSRKKERGTKTDSTVNMLEIFKPHEECSQPRKVLIEGQPGMGKTTYCNKIAYDWAKNCKAGDYFPDVQVLLLLKCRDIHSDLWEAIDDQLLPKDMNKKEREKFFTFIRNHHAKVLLVLDGLDELPAHKLPAYKEIIQGRMLPKCHLVVTARPEAGIKVRKCCDTLLEVEGFTENDAEDFIQRYFKTKEHLAKKLLNKLHTDASLKGLTASPLNTALLCLLCENFQGDLPKGRTLLFLEIVRCVLRRYRRKKELPETDEDLIKLHHAELKDLGCIALNGLLNDFMYFKHSTFDNCTSDLMREFGFLSVQPGCSKGRTNLSYGFLHKSIQEWFGAFYLCCQLVDEKISPDSLVADTRYLEELQQVLSFTCGILAQMSEVKALALMESIACQINQSINSSNHLCAALKCINECEKDQGTFAKKLAHSLGSLLQIQSTFSYLDTLSDSGAAVLAHVLESNSSLTGLDLSLNNISESGVAALAKAMERNQTLTNLNLLWNDIDDLGAAALAKALERNSTLTELILYHNNIGDLGATALAKAVERNSTLKQLDLSCNEIGDSGAVALAQAVKTNLTLRELRLFGNRISAKGACALAEAKAKTLKLTELNLYGNNMSDSGAAALARSVEKNSTLTNLNLFHNNISDSGAAALAKAMERNSTLTKLDMSYNDISDSGAAALAEAIERNSMLTTLNLAGNNISDSGAAALAKAMEKNSTLTKLDLSYNDMGDSSVVALAEAMERNPALTVLNLYRNRIGDSGAAALARSVEKNSTLTNLNFCGNCIGESGAAALAKALERNSTLTELNLIGNNIGDSGAAALAEAIERNSMLTELNLAGNNISDSGAAALAKAMERNPKVTELDLSFNYMGDSSVVALAGAMERNPSLTVLSLYGNKIGDSGAAALARSVERNSTLTTLNLFGNKIGETGAAVLAIAVERNSTLTELNFCDNCIGESGAAALAKALERN